MVQRFSAFIIFFIGLQMSFAQLETAQEEYMQVEQVEVMLVI